ncbi:MAG: carboxypeptidase-like regulatory domain-containing protein, partial [Saprospiraceae bacterium]|nr:carboxypeptidase-like regulatory domain-containing protein [Saprospiraceae bacterium]
MLKKLMCLCLLLGTLAYATAQQTITGTVTDEDGIALIGVSILEEGTLNGTITDFDGGYSLTVAGDATLVFSYTGMNTKSEQVNGRSV